MFIVFAGLWAGLAALASMLTGALTGLILHWLYPADETFPILERRR